MTVDDDEGMNDVDTMKEIAPINQSGDYTLQDYQDIAFHITCMLCIHG